MIAVACLLLSIPLATGESHLAELFTALLRVAALLFGLAGLCMIALDLLRPQTKSSSGERSSADT